jgi:hypothetical protein
LLFLFFIYSHTQIVNKQNTHTHTHTRQELDAALEEQQRALDKHLSSAATLERLCEAAPRLGLEHPQLAGLCADVRVIREGVARAIGASLSSSASLAAGQDSSMHGQNMSPAGPGGARRPASPGMSPILDQSRHSAPRPVDELEGDVHRRRSARRRAEADAAAAMVVGSPKLATQSSPFRRRSPSPSRSLASAMAQADIDGNGTTNVNIDRNNDGDSLAGLDRIPQRGSAGGRGGGGSSTTSSSSSSSSSNNSNNNNNNLNNINSNTNNYTSMPPTKGTTAEEAHGVVVGDHDGLYGAALRDAEAARRAVAGEGARLRAANAALQGDVQGAHERLGRVSNEAGALGVSLARLWSAALDSSRELTQAPLATGSAPELTRIRQEVETGRAVVERVKSEARATKGALVCACGAVFFFFFFSFSFLCSRKTKTKTKTKNNH